VDANSPAAWVGLRKGGIVLAVNQKKVATPEEFDKAVADTEANKPLLMLIKQGDTVRYISLKVGQ
jgi:serine protease Do